MQFNISIPTPCSANWNEMTPTENGRHCGLCAKTVVDFTGWETDDIASYLVNNQSHSICGRLRETQLATDYFVPDNYIYQVHHSSLSFLKKVAAVMIFVCCIAHTGFAQQPVNMPAPVEQHKTGETKSDSVIVPAQPVLITMGAVAVAPEPIKKVDSTRFIMGKMLPPKRKQ